MSAKAVTERLKLVSELTRLCVSLGTAKIESNRVVARKPKTRKQRHPKAAK